MSKYHKYLTFGAVMTGSFVIFMPLVVVVTLATADALQMLFNSGILGRPYTLIIGLVLGYITSMEVTRIRLHGYNELRRGTNLQQLLRHSALLLVVSSAIVVLARVLYNGLLFGISNNDMVVLILSAASIVALIWVIIRSVNSFWNVFKNTNQNGL